jgi:hypothetical protein
MSRFSSGASEAAFQRYTLLSDWRVSPDTKILRFALPDRTLSLGASAPAGLKVRSSPS